MIGRSTAGNFICPLFFDGGLQLSNKYIVYFVDFNKNMFDSNLILALFFFPEGLSRI